MHAAHNNSYMQVVGTVNQWVVSGVQLQSTSKPACTQHVQCYCLHKHLLWIQHYRQSFKNICPGPTSIHKLKWQKDFLSKVYHVITTTILVTSIWSLHSKHAWKPYKYCLKKTKVRHITALIIDNATTEILLAHNLWALKNVMTINHIYSCVCVLKTLRRVCSKFKPAFSWP